MASHRTERCDFDWFRPAGEILNPKDYEKRSIVLLKANQCFYIVFCQISRKPSRRTEKCFFCKKV